MSQQQPGIFTRSIHAGQTADPATGALAVPIYQTTSFVFKDADDAADLFALRKFGNIYTRIMNPTTDVFEKRVAALHNGAGALATAAGMSAVFYSIINITSAGQNFVSTTNLYGGTVTLFTHTLKRLGIEARLVDTSDPRKVEAAIDENTRLIFTESVGNPKNNVDDLEALAEVAHRHKIPLIVDNTMVPPPLFDPFEYGADIIVYAATKMIGGHGTTSGGVIVEKGDFDWKGAGKFPEITEPDPSYHGVNFWDAFGWHDKAVAKGLAYILKMRTGILRDIGACQAPFNSFLLLQGLETLPLRAERHVKNAQQVAEYLEKHPAVSWVNYPGLPSHRDYKNAQKYLKKGAGAMIGFGIKGGLEAGRHFVGAVKLAKHLANVLDAKTLVIHPASTTHQQLSEQQQLEAGVTPDFIRLSVGLEDVEDITADLDQALRSAQQHVGG